MVRGSTIQIVVVVGVHRSHRVWRKAESATASARRCLTGGVLPGQSTEWEVAMPNLRPEGARQLRILVVDDCEDIRDVFCLFIARTGHLTRTACDGQEAVEILQEESFDLMLLDLTMPRMGGIEVARWLQAHPDVAPAMHVVVVTAWGGQNVKPLTELGVKPVIQKPLPLQRLNARIAETLLDLESPQPVG